MDLNPLITAFKAQPPVDPGVAPLPSTMVMPSAPVLPSAPALPAPVLNHTMTDQANLQRLVSSGDGISQVQNPVGRAALRTADILGSVFAPRIAQFIPGTTLHHNLLVGQAQKQVTNDQAQAAGDASVANTQAEARIHTVQADEAENPTAAPPEYDYVDGPNGKVAILKGTTTGTNVTVGGQPLGNKPTTPTNEFELWHQQNPQGTAADFNLLQAKPLSQPEADAFNRVIDPMASKHNLPTGNFKAGMPHADAVQLQSSIYNAIGKQQGDTHITIQQAAQQASQAAKAPLDTSDPDMQASVNAVANGSMKLQDVFGRGATTAQKATFAAAVKAVNPAFNSGDHDIENASRRYMTAGQGGQTLTAFNTAQNHLDILRQASDELQNGNITAFNELGNSYAKATGDPAPTDFNAVKNAVKGEVARALTGNVTVSEQSELDKDFNNASSPRQIAGVAHKYIQLIDGKKQAMKATYDAAQKGQVNFGADSTSSGAATHTYNPVTGKIEAIGGGK